MTINTAIIENLNRQCQDFQAKWVAVTKKQDVQTIQELYDLGLRHFGENKVQDFLEKYSQLPSDISWHFIGHLQTNKVRPIIDKVSFIHAIDSPKLLKTIQKEAIKIDKKIKLFVQVHIAEEESKYGFYKAELIQFFNDLNHNDFPNIHIRGLMAMATNTDDKIQILNEFKEVRGLQEEINRRFNLELKELSMGMSGDYQLALESGSTLLRIGSILYH